MRMHLLALLLDGPYEGEKKREKRGEVSSWVETRPWLK